MILHRHHLSLNNKGSPHQSSHHFQTGTPLANFQKLKPHGEGDSLEDLHLVVAGSSDKALIGDICRYYVVCQLIRHGWPIDLTFKKYQNLGILIKDISTDKFKIKVKTARHIKGSHGWHMSSHHETVISDNLFYAFIDIGEQPSSPIVSYILPSKRVADCLRKTHQVWLDTPGRGGKPHSKKGDLCIKIRKASIMRLINPKSEVKILACSGPLSFQPCCLLPYCLVVISWRRKCH